MSRVVVPAAEEIVGKEFSCLNKGHVILVDYMGGDYSVVQAARVSYAKDEQPFDPDKDTKLINYLMAHRHTTPFEMVQIKVRMKLPIFVARQWVRHRTASLNEVSSRYTQLSDDFYLPELKDIQPQSESNKQGRSEDSAFKDGVRETFRDQFEHEQLEAYHDYNLRIKDDMAKELARINLPVSIYTEWYWNQNLWNMLHLLSLRMDSHAQYEIRVYANALYQIVRKIAPISLAAWEEHVYLGARFSKSEMEILAEHLTPWDAGEGLAAIDKLGKRGSDEFFTKLKTAAVRVANKSHPGDPWPNQ